MRDHEIVRLYEQMRRRFTELTGREPITSGDFDTIDAAVARVRARTANDSSPR